MDLYVFLTHEEAFFNWTESALLVIWSCCKEPKVPPIISTLLKARAEKAFESTARGIQAPTGRRGEVGGGVLVDRTAGTVPQCLAGSGEIPFHSIHTSFFPSFPASLCFSSSLTLSSLQVTVVRVRLSWGKLTARINKWTGLLDVHTHTPFQTERYTLTLAFQHSLSESR